MGGQNNSIVNVILTQLNGFKQYSFLVNEGVTKNNFIYV